jgi:hypothetical protein
MEPSSCGHRPPLGEAVCVASQYDSLTCWMIPELSHVPATEVLARECTSMATCTSDLKI